MILFQSSFPSKYWIVDSIYLQPTYCCLQSSTQILGDRLLRAFALGLCLYPQAVAIFGHITGKLNTQRGLRSEKFSSFWQFPPFPAHGFFHTNLKLKVFYNIMEVNREVETHVLANFATRNRTQYIPLWEVVTPPPPEELSGVRVWPKLSSVTAFLGSCH